MKAYKKIAKVIPVAVLSTSVLFAPVITFAAENPATAKTVPIHTLATENPVTAQQIKDWLTTVGNDLSTRGLHLKDLGVTDPSGEFPLGEFTSVDSLKYTYLGSGELKLQASAIADGSPEDVVLAQATNKDPENTGEIQTYKTPSSSYTTTNTFTVGNEEGLVVSLASETKAEVEVPFVAGVEEKITMKVDTSYKHTESNTATKTETVTFPSQDIKVAPHTTVKLYSTVYKQQFEGTDTQSNVAIDADMNFYDGRYKLKLYQLVKKYSTFNKLPSYIQLDDTNQQVLVKGVVTKFSGVAGHASEGYFVTVKNDDNPSQQPVKMSLENYNNPTMRAKLLNQGK